MKKWTLFFSIFFLIGCSATNDGKWTKSASSHFGATVGAVSAGSTCYHLISQNAPLVAACAVIGSFAGAELFYKSDQNIHTAVFVDHLNTSPVKPSYTTWFNPRTGNNGDIKINRTYVIDSGMKCSDYISTMNITTQWPIAGINRSQEFGTACQHPDGVWEVVNATS